MYVNFLTEDWNRACRDLSKLIYERNRQKKTKLNLKHAKNTEQNQYDFYI